jgi:hypothetical protein
MIGACSPACSVSDEFQPELPPYGSSSALQRVQRNSGILRIEQPVQRSAAGLHAFSHSRFAEMVFFHRGLDLIGKDLLERLLLALFQNALRRQEVVKSGTDLAFFSCAISEHLLHAFERDLQILRRGLRLT